MTKLIERVVVYCKKMGGQDMALMAMDKQQLGKTIMGGTVLLITPHDYLENSGGSGTLAASE